MISTLHSETYNTKSPQPTDGFKILEFLQSLANIMSHIGWRIMIFGNTATYVTLIL